MSNSFLAGDKGQVRRQARVQGGEAAEQHRLSLEHGGVDARGGALEVGPRLRSARVMTFSQSH